MPKASLSTHVLDTAFGKPRAGVHVALYRDATRVAEGTTDDDGRVKELAKDLAPGSYRLAFALNGPFLEELSVTVHIEEGHYHVPLLVSPFGAMTYRGS